MALDIRVFGPKESNVSKQDSAILDDDGYYWYLYPYFEQVWSSTGQMIDLYGDATFRDENLRILDNILNDAYERVQQQPAEWDEVIAEQILPVRQPIYGHVIKAQLLSLITTLRALISKAIEVKGVLSCIGD